MNAKLAELYGTNVAEDAEKLASAEMAEALADEQALDVDNLTDEDIEAMAAEVLAGGEKTAEAEEEEAEETEETEEEATETEESAEETETEETEETEEATEETDEAAEKLASADFVGRVMAHSFTQELREIEKQAGKFGPGNLTGKATARAHQFAGKAKQVARGAAASVKGKANKAVGKVDKHLQGVGDAAIRKATGVGNGAASKGARRGVGAGIYGAGAAAATAAGIGAKKAFGKKEKAASALDTLAQERALAILAANGVEVEKTASSREEILDQAIQARAEELLRANGYAFEGDEQE